jgi:hypothetical protein
MDKAFFFMASTRELNAVLSLHQTLYLIKTSLDEKYLNSERTDQWAITRQTGFRYRFGKGS